MPPLRLQFPTPPVGYWYLHHGSIFLPSQTRPGRWHRFWIRHLLGVDWIDRLDPESKGSAPSDRSPNTQ